MFKHGPLKSRLDCSVVGFSVIRSSRMVTAGQRVSSLITGWGRPVNLGFHAHPLHIIPSLHDNRAGWKTRRHGLFACQTHFPDHLSNLGPPAPAAYASQPHRRSTTSGQVKLQGAIIEGCRLCNLGVCPSSTVHDQVGDVLCWPTEVLPMTFGPVAL